MTNFWLWVTITVVLTFVVVVVVSYFQSRHILRPRGYKKPLDFHPDLYKLVYEPINFKTKDDVTLKGWFIASKNKTDKTIILLHGWGSNKSNVLSNVHFLNEAGYNLFCFDFRCCGESGGKISSIGYLETKDFDAAMDFLRTYKAESSKKIGIYSISMGASVAIYQAPRYPQIKCLVAEAAFGSYGKAVARWAWVKRKIPYYPCIPLTLLFVRMKLKSDPEKFSPIYHIDKVSPKPIFFIHGSCDNLVVAKNA
jgi:pimeloyl-ACP methyl ester carboxylesterase